MAENRLPLTRVSLAVHGFDHLHNVVLTLGVKHIKLGEVRHIQPVGEGEGNRDQSSMEQKVTKAAPFLERPR